MVVSLNVPCSRSFHARLPSLRDLSAVTAKYAISPSPRHSCPNDVFHSFQNLAPIYEQLGDAFSHAKDKVVVAKVDADGEGRPLGQKYGVTGFPSEWFAWCIVGRFASLFTVALKWFDAEGNVENYEGGRDLDALASL